MPIAPPAAKLAPIIVRSGLDAALGVGMEEIERRTVSKLTRRLVPLLIACYFVAILDRGNVAVAALTMNHDLGLSATAFGLAAGIFFLPYFLFELPSNLALQRFGARLWATLASPRVLVLALAYYGLTGLNSGVSTFLPLILKGLGMGNVRSGFVAAIPYAFGALGMVGLGVMADRAGMRKAANLTALAISASGLVLASTTDSPVLKLAFLCFAALGLFGCMPVFWGLPTGFLSASTAAGGIALINALGNLSGFVNPYAMGAIRDATGSFNGGLLWLAVMAAMSFTILFIVIRQPAPEALPAAAE